MRGDQLARQWQLIQRLARSRTGVGLNELAEDLDCVRRTVYRDLDALMYAGFPVVSERRDNHVYYRFLDSFRLGDVPFTPDEVLALAFGADLLRTLEGTVFHDSIQSALSKIRSGLGPELGAYLERLADSFRVLPGPHKRYADFRETIQVLNNAVLRQVRVRIRYRTGSTGTVRTRMLDPYRVWYRSGGLYVIGHDHRTRTRSRTFAVDRIRTLRARNERALRASPASFDFDAYTASSFGVIAEPATSTVRIRFDEALYALYVERAHLASRARSSRARCPTAAIELSHGGGRGRPSCATGCSPSAATPRPWCSDELRLEIGEERTRCDAAATASGGGCGDAESLGVARDSADPGPGPRHAEARLSLRRRGPTARRARIDGRRRTPGSRPSCRVRANWLPGALGNQAQASVRFGHHRVHVRSGC